MGEIFSTVDLEPKEKLVMLAFADHASDEGVCWVSIRTMMVKTSISRGAIHRIIAVLESKKFLARTERFLDDKQTTNLWVILPYPPSHQWDTPRPTGGTQNHHVNRKQETNRIENFFEPTTTGPSTTQPIPLTAVEKRSSENKAPEPQSKQERPLTPSFAAPLPPQSSQKPQEAADGVSRLQAVSEDLRKQKPPTKPPRASGRVEFELVRPQTDEERDAAYKIKRQQFIDSMKKDQQ